MSELLVDSPENSDLEFKMMQRVDDVIAKAVRANNPHYAARQMQTLIEAQQLVGKTLAKFLYEMRNAWTQFTLSSQESFTEFAAGS
jgi:hypothetical protein